MSIFASQVTKRQEFACSPGEFFTAKKLSAMQAKETFNASDDYLRMAELVIRHGLTALNDSSEFDRASVLSDISSDALNEIIVAVTELTVPGAGATKAEAAVEQKNDVGASTSA